MKKKIYSIVKIIIFLLILFICIQIICNVTKKKDSYNKASDFFEQKQDFDVLFFGTSHMINGIYPMDLWNDYGIVSYNMGKYGESMATIYYDIMLATQHRKPKLIVLDTLLMTTDKIDSNDMVKTKANMHNALDIYKNSYLKYSAIKDLFDSKDLLNNEIEYLFNFSMYHSRWKELNKQDFIQINNYKKGAYSVISVAVPNKMNDFNSIEASNLDGKIAIQYIYKIIQYCKDNNIELMFTYLPYPAADAGIANSKYIKKISEEENINYINFLNMNIVNYQTDCYDRNSHLNPSGARKVTDYIGKYLIENYDIQDQRKNEVYKFWDNDYNNYIDFKIRNLTDYEKNLNNFLMLLYDERDIIYEIKISSKKKIEEGSTLQKLLANINNNYEIDDEAFKDNKDKTVKITTWDNRTGKEIKTVWF